MDIAEAGKISWLAAGGIPGRAIRVLTIGHSYVVEMNRSIVREVARDPGFEVTVAAPSFFRDELRSIALEPEPPDSPLTLRPLDAYWTNRVHLFGYHPGQLRDLMAGDYDVVHAWEEPYIFAGWQIAHSLSNRDVPYCFRTAQSYNKHYPFPFNWFERRALARADRWIAGAGLVRQAMLDRGYPSSTGSVLTLAVDTARFRPLEADRKAEIREKLGLDGPVIAFVGRPARAKGIPLLMEALEKLPRNRKWSLLLLGRGEWEGELWRWVRRQRFGNRVRVILAAHNDVPEYLGAADMLVAPSQTTPNWREQFGRMIIEAFACGVPVLGSNSGEIPHVIGEAGMVLPERDVTAWSKAIESLLDDPEQRGLLARRGLERVRQYSVTALANSYRDFYRSLALVRR